jgi:predicted XRE-type DNA-binding protein
MHPTPPDRYLVNRYKSREHTEKYMTKLTKSQIEEIQKKYLTEGITQQKLAEEYDVQQSYISRLMDGRKPRFRASELDAVDRIILLCIGEREGLSMVDVFRCYNLEAVDTPHDEQYIRFKIRSLEKKGFVRTIRMKGKPAVRRCYIADDTNFEDLVGRTRDGNNFHTTERVHRR